MPPSPQYRPETAILSLGDGFYDPVEAADFPQTILRWRGDRAAADIGLQGLDEEEWLRHFGRFERLPDGLGTPLALRYHGHQFRSYNPEIGDGRGFLFAQMRDQRGRLMDLGTKGSGQTPWSRFGDGRLTLKGAVRELLATEMLEALGVETSRTLSIVETGEALHRGDEASPTRSAVLVRLSHGHIRIGTFQRLAALGDAEGMQRLVGYCLRHFFADEPGGDDAPARLLAHVVARVARLAPSYMAAGFVHGVLNSDNINVTGESFDYGPWRFTPYWDPGFTAAYFDQTGLYAFGRQAEAIHWDVVQLAVSLRLIAEAEALMPALEGYQAAHEAALSERMLWRLGVKPRGPEADKPLVSAIEAALSAKTVEIDRFFFEWAGGRRREGPGFADVTALLDGYEPARSLDHPYWSDPAPCSLHIDEVEAIWRRIDEADDWSALYAKVQAIRRMGEAMRL